MNIAFFLLACVELLKLQFLASYGFLALGHTLPFAASSLAFFASILLARILKRTGGLRLLTRLLAHLAAFTLCCLATFAIFSGLGPSPASLFAGMAVDPLGASVVLAALGVFWLRGIWLEAAPPSHEFAIARFDEGIAEFLLVLVMAAVLKLENPEADSIALPYFIFSILALGSFRLRTARRGGFRERGRWAVLTSSAAAFALAAFGLVRLVPALGAPARKAAASLGAASLGILKFLEMIIVWLFKPRAGRSLIVADEAVHPQASVPPGAEEGYSLFATIIMWAAMGLLAFIILFLLAFLIASLVRHLARRSPKSPARLRKPGAGKWFAAFLRRLSSFIAALFPRRRARECDPVLAAYARLLACGRAGGVRRSANETPREFSLRLRLHFPRASAGAEFIVGMLEAEIYGARIPSGDSLAALKAARSRMRPLGFLIQRLVPALARRG